MPKQDRSMGAQADPPANVEEPMLRSVKELLGYTILASDGEVGTCEDLLFDDQYWTVRFVVVDVGKWSSGKRTVISPVFLDEPDWESRRLPAALTRKEIEEAPGVDEHAPVSRQYEIQYFGYHGIPAYWWGGDVWGRHGFPYLLRDEAAQPSEGETSSAQVDPHLRSVLEVGDYRIQASDGQIGHVEDFVMEVPTYAVRYLVVDTRDWLPGRKVLVSTDWIESISYSLSKVHVDLKRDLIENGPEFDPSEPVNRKYEAKLYDYYGRPKWWE